MFAEIIYENFLFDIPKLFDLCALYGHANAALLAKMVTNVFMQQPQYVDDLRTAVPTIIQVYFTFSSGLLNILAQNFMMKHYHKLQCHAERLGFYFKVWYKK